MKKTGATIFTLALMLGARILVGMARSSMQEDNSYIYNQSSHNSGYEHYQHEPYWSDF